MWNEATRPGLFASKRTHLGDLRGLALDSCAEGIGQSALCYDAVTMEHVAENLILKLVPHQGCVITPTADGIEIAGSAQNWVMSAAVAPFPCRPPFIFRIVGKTDSTNLRMHFHRGELIFNWECSVRELRVHDPATAKQHELPGRGFLTTDEWHEISWEIRLDNMRVVVDGEVRFESGGDYSDISSAPSVGPCFGSTVSVREFNIILLD